MTAEWPLEHEAQKPEVQLRVVVYFHAEAEELAERSSALRHAIETAISEDEALTRYAYREVRLEEEVAS